MFHSAATHSPNFSQRPWRISRSAWSPWKKLKTPQCRPGFRRRWLRSSLCLTCLQISLSSGKTWRKSFWVKYPSPTSAFFFFLFIGDRLLPANKMVISDKEFSHYLNVVPALPYQERHRDLQLRRMGGVGLWVLDTPQFLSWRDGTSKSNILWLNGGPGVGKTYIRFVSPSRSDMRTRYLTKSIARASSIISAGLAHRRAIPPSSSTSSTNNRSKKTH